MSVEYQQPAITDLTGALSPELHLRSADLESIVDDLMAYHARFAPLFTRQEQREWAAVYLRGLLVADVPRKNVEAMALRLLGAGTGRSATSGRCNTSSARAPGTMTPSWRSTSATWTRRWAKPTVC